MELAIGSYDLCLNGGRSLERGNCLCLLGFRAQYRPRLERHAVGVSCLRANHRLVQAFSQKGHSASSRMIRGGAWLTPAMLGRSGNRAFYFPPDTRSDYVGFRVAFSSPAGITESTEATGQ